MTAIWKLFRLIWTFGTKPLLQQFAEMRAETQLNLDRLRPEIRKAHLPYDDESALNQAWIHAVRADSSVGLAFNHCPYTPRRPLHKDSFWSQVVERNLALSRQLSGIETPEGARLLALKQEAKSRRKVLTAMLPARRLTDAEILYGPVMGLSPAPRFWQVRGLLDSLENWCDFERMLAEIEREIALGPDSA